MKKNTSGFALFVAVIVSSLLLIVVLSISSLAYKETILSNTGKESQFAFYAADSARECALFWDLQNPSPTGERGDQGAFISPKRTIQCGEGTVSYVSPTGGVGLQPGMFIFDPNNPDDPTLSPDKPRPGKTADSTFDVAFDNGTCGHILVRKFYIRPVLTSPSILKTHIESSGQTDCNNLTNPRRFERTIKDDY